MDLTLLSDVANVVIGILFHAEETKNRYIFVNSFVSCQRVVLEVLEGELGMFKVETIAAKQANEEGNAKVRKGDFSGMKTSLMGVMAGGEGGVNGWGRDNEMLLGRTEKGVSELREAVVEVVREGKEKEG